MGRNSRSKSSAESTEGEGTKSQDGNARDDSEIATLAVVREMMKIQESMFKSMFESLMTSLSNCVDNITETVAGLKANLDYCQNQANDLKKSIEFTQGEAEKEISLVKHSITLHQNKLEALENHSKRNNIRVNGIPESVERETWESIESKVKDVISD